MNKKIIFSDIPLFHGVLETYSRLITRSKNRSERSNVADLISLNHTILASHPRSEKNE
jgi:hypothetical protein